MKDFKAPREGMFLGRLTFLDHSVVDPDPVEAGTGQVGSGPRIKVPDPDPDLNLWTRKS
jgi:hypothetical protein